MTVPGDVLRSRVAQQMLDWREWASDAENDLLPAARSTFRRCAAELAKLLASGELTPPDQESRNEWRGRCSTPGCDVALILRSPLVSQSQDWPLEFSTPCVGCGRDVLVTSAGEIPRPTKNSKGLPVEPAGRNGIVPESTGTFDVRDPAQPAARTGWQDIATAPTDGPEVLLGWFAYDESGMCRVGFWHPRENAWCDTHQVLHNQWSFPTHWMPLPLPPEPTIAVPAAPQGKET